MPLRYLNRSNSSTTISAGNSVLFNGSNQYLSIANNAAFNLGTGSFTVECWFYATANVSSQRCLITNYSGPSAGWAIQITSGVIGANLYGDGFAISGGSLAINTWYHAALSGAQGSIKLFLNGVQVGSTYTGAVSMNTSAAVTIGNIVNTAHMAGYISNARVVKGTALYTSNFTPSTSPLTAIANTSLLTCKSATIVDASSNNFTITNNGAATVSSTVPFTASFAPAPSGMKFGNRNNSVTATQTGKSVQFNGSNQYLSIPRILDNSTDVTIEAWVRVTSASDAYIVAQYVAGSVNRTIFYVGANLKVGIQIGSTYVDSVAAIALNTWYHLAWVRSGSGTNNFSTYINGVRDGQMTYTGTFHNTPTTIGGSNNYDAYGSSYFSGYISNLRILKGTALYTSNFTPPTAPLTAIANTSLLTCNAATIVDGSTNNFTITNNNSATVSSITPFTVASAASTTRVRKVYADAVSSIITSGLVLNLDASNVSSYPGSGTSWFDLSGNGNTGTLTNGPTYTGSFGGIIVFDGNNDYVENSNFSSIVSSSFTISAWVKWTSISGTTQKIMHAQNGTPEVNIDNYNGGSGNPKIHFYTAAAGSTNNILTSGEDIQIGTWYHINGVFDNTTKYKYLYVNSVLKNSASTGVQISWPNSFTRFGNRLDATEPFNGVMSQVGIYNRPLSASEVLQNYNVTRAKFGL